jgi:asparagine N-glycosylation enzyme membrane subunit Stt3
MLNGLPGYRTALNLSIVIALISLVGWSFILADSRDLEWRYIAICIIPFLIAFGLWVQSVIVSSLAVLWMLFWAGALARPVVFDFPRVSEPRRTVPLAAFFLICAILSLLTAAIIFLSKKFRTEFTYERKHQPKYKTYLRWPVFSALIAAMLIATFIDIIMQASPP